ncbi:hypothetical protein MHH70_17250 [Metasolibacillus sp. FSL H7-0170]|uniref:hypothetical protein n=1 Tax=Metasolibacillus sp. FSL H7-0170 TaxID=2921431 RepID=UPI0031592212
MNNNLKDTVSIHNKPRWEWTSEDWDKHRNKTDISHRIMLKSERDRFNSKKEDIIMQNIIADLLKRDIIMQNTVADLLKKIGYGIFIIGFVGGISLANTEFFISLFDSKFVWTIAIVIWINSFIVGMLFIGFAELIKIQDNQSLMNSNINKKILNELQKLNSLLEESQKENVLNSNINNKQINETFGDS